MNTAAIEDQIGHTLEQEAAPRARRQNTTSLWGVDTLYNRGFLTKDQHMGCVHIRWWWECFSTASLRALSIERVVHEQGFDLDRHLTNKLTSRDYFSRALRGVQAKHPLFWQVCFELAIEERGMREVSRRLGKGNREGAEFIKEALDVLYKVLEDEGLLFKQRPTD